MRMREGTFALTYGDVDDEDDGRRVGCVGVEVVDHGAFRAWHVANLEANVNAACQL